MSRATSWGPWHLDFATEELHTDPASEVGARFGIALERCQTPAEVLNWIFEVYTKVWATPAVVAGLIAALNDLGNHGEVSP